MSYIEELAGEIEKPLKELAKVFKEWYVKSGIEEKMPLTNHDKALEAYKAGNIEQAIYYFEKCLEKHGIFGLSAETRANCANHLSVIYSKSDDGSKALAYLIYAAEVAPENIMYQKNLAGYYWNNKAFEAAYHQAKKCVNISADDDSILEAAQADCAKILGMLEKFSHEFSSEL